MKKAGDLISYFFDEQGLAKAQGYSKLFAAWDTLMRTYKIPAAADHSRIVELERHILLIEADHPGWIQILQTKQRELLNQFQRRFPDLAIRGISFRLSRRPVSSGTQFPAEDTETRDEPTQTGEEPAEEPLDQEQAQAEENPGHPYSLITDDTFKKTLKRLEREIALRNRALKDPPQKGKT